MGDDLIDLAALSEAVKTLERIQADLAAVAARTDDGRRRDLVKFRRELSAQIALVGRLAAPLFVEAPTNQLEFRRRYSAMLSAAALHQAEWPAIRLGEFEDQYRESAQRVRSANAAFLTWLHQQLYTDAA